MYVILFLYFLFVHSVVFFHLKVVSELNQNISCFHFALVFCSIITVFGTLWMSHHNTENFWVNVQLQICEIPTTKNIWAKTSVLHHNSKFKVKDYQGNIYPVWNLKQEDLCRFDFTMLILIDHVCATKRKGCSMA